MIRLAARLAVSGGRESIVRLSLTALGVAVGTTLLLVAAAADPAVRAQQRHTAWQYTGVAGDPGPPELEATGDPLLWRLTKDAVDGRELTVLRVAATGPGSPIPLGLSQVPRAGEVYVSPALAQLIDKLPANRLADRFPSAPAGTIGDDYLAGPDDLVAVIGMPADALRGPPSAGAGLFTVHHIRTRPAEYQFTDFLRLMLGIGVVGLLMPVLVFVSTSTRIGAARREQRFAALRLAGATPRQTNVLAAVEAGAAATAGAALGAVGFALLRPLVARIEIDGHQSFVGDVRVAPILLAAILLTIPVLAVAAAMVSLRRVQASPLGVARRAVRARPTVRRLVPLVVGSIGFVAAVAAAAGNTGIEMLVPVMAAFVLMIYGIVAAGPWFTVLTARAIGRTGQRSSALLAGRRLEDDPTAGFRAVSGLVVAVFVASVFSGVTPAVLAEGHTGRRGLVDATTMVAGLPQGTGAASATDALDAAASAGAGLGVVLHTDPDPERPLADPSIGRSHTLLAACADLAVLDVNPPCPAGGTTWVDTGLTELHFEPAPYTAADAARLPAELIVVTTNGAVATTDRVRTAIQHAVPGATPWLEAEADRDANRRLIQLNRLTNLALALTLTIRVQPGRRRGGRHHRAQAAVRPAPRRRDASVRTATDRAARGGGATPAYRPGQRHARSRDVRRHCRPRWRHPLEHADRRLLAQPHRRSRRGARRCGGGAAAAGANQHALSGALRVATRTTDPGTTPGGVGCPRTRLDVGVPYQSKSGPTLSLGSAM
jgi:hypothetical protein